MTSILTICLIILIVPVVYAKYIDVYKLFCNQKVANPIFIVGQGDTAKIDKINNVGYYEFSIKNFDQEKISDVGFLYTIEVVPKTNKIPQFELYNEDKSIILNNLKTNQLSIKGKEKVEEKYCLKIIYDINKLEENDKDLGEVQIKVYSEQEKM